MLYTFYSQILPNPTDILGPNALCSIYITRKIADVSKLDSTHIMSILFT